MTIIALLAVVGMPPGAVPKGSFPLDGLWNWLRQVKASASASIPSLPQPQEGSAAGQPHYVDAARTDSGRGTGSAPKTAKGAVPLTDAAPDATPMRTRRVAGPEVFDPRPSQRQADGATESSNVYRNTDGSYARVIKQDQLNYKDSTGSWKAVDRALARAADGRFAQKASTTDITFGGRGDDADLVRLGLDPTTEVSYGLLGAVGVEPLTEDNAVTYRDVLPHTDLKLEALADATKESIILHSAAAGNEFVFPIKAKNLTATLEADGAVVLRDRKGDVRASIPQGFMVDSAFDRATGDFTRSDAVTYQLVTLGDGRQALKVILDQAWLDDPARVWPVTVDPTVQGNFKSTGDTYVYATDTSDHSGENNLAIGTYDSGAHKARSLIHFDGFGSTYKGNTISKAWLHIFLSWTWDCNSRQFNVLNTNSSWAVSTIDWPGPTQGSLIGSKAVASSRACGNTGGNRSVGDWVWVDLDLVTVQAWANGGTNYGVELVAPSETTSNQWKRFTSRNYSNGTYQPELVVYYSGNVVPQVDSMYPPHGFQSTTLTPTLIARAHDPDATPGKFTYQFVVKERIKDSDGEDASQIVKDTGKITTGKWTVPSGILQWGKNYTWSVVVNDTIATSKPIEYALGTPVPQPPVFASLAQNSGKGFQASVGNYTTDVTDVAIPTAGPPLTIQRSYNSHDYRTSSAFGVGWSSMLDLKATETLDPAQPTAKVVTVRYPGGQEVAFGPNADGSFAAPAGKYSTFAKLCQLSGADANCSVAGAVKIGYQLVDKDGTRYRFAQLTSGTSGVNGVYGISSLADVHKRTMTFAYTSNLITKVTSASGRALTIAWTATNPAHVMTVTTDPATPGQPTTASEFRYTYSGDRLADICHNNNTECTDYTYTAETHSPYRATVMNLGPSVYWRPGTTGVDTGDTANAIDQVGLSNGVYTNVTTGQAGPLAASTAKSAQFNGSSSWVQLPTTVDTESTQRSVSMWFRTTGSGVLLGQSAQETFPTATNWDYTPVLYVDANGYLHGQFPTVPVKPASGAISLGTLHGAGSGLCLDIPNQVTTDGTRPQLWTCNGSAAQIWSLDSSDRITATIGGVTKCLDVKSGGTANGTVIQIWTCNTTLAQKWSFTPEGNVVSQLSGKCLDAVANGTTNGTLMHTWDCFPETKGHGNQIWTAASTHKPMLSTTRVNNDAWHHAVLTSEWSSSSETQIQKLYLDGSLVTSKTGTPAARQKYTQLGAGFKGTTWPTYNGTADSATTYPNTGSASYFGGYLAEVALFNRPLSAAEVSALQTAKATSVKPLDTIVRPSGAISANIDYNAASGLVTQVVDENGGVWKIDPAKVTGSFQTHGSAVLGAKPADYWRMAETQASDAVNEVDGDVATYSNVALGVDGGPFDDALKADWDTEHANYAPSFDGTSSYVALPPADYGKTGPNSISLWFKVDDTETNGGPLYSWQSHVVTSTTQTSFVNALYVATDGRLRGKWCWCNGVAPMASPSSVRDGKWHHAVTTTSTTTQKLYLDGAQVASLTANPDDGALANYVNVGAGIGSLWSGLSSDTNYFQGNIAEVAFYKSELSAAQVAGQYDTRDTTIGGSLARRYAITDPSLGKLTSETFDVATGRKLVETNALGKETSYGYDADGYLAVVADPLGHLTTQRHDARGNIIQETTCQDYSTEKCTTTYSSYFPDRDTKVLQADPATGLYDPRNDKLIWQRLPGSTDETDDRFLTTLTYDALTGDRLTTTDPLGRVAKNTYTTATTPAYNGGTTPAGLPLASTTAQGATKTASYYANGDVAELAESTGKVTRYAYDGVGNVVTRTDITDTLGSQATTMTYDTSLRLRTQTDPAVRNRVTNAVHTAKTTYTYNGDGLLTNTVIDDLTGGDASRSLATDYDTHGLPSQITDANGKVTVVTYDTSGRIKTKTDPNGVLRAYAYDAAGQLLTSTLKNYTGDPSNPVAPADFVVESRAYDDAGRIATVTDANGAKTTYTYTDNGLTAKITRVSADGTKTYVIEEDFYDESGFLIKQITNNGATTATYKVDNGGRTYESALDPGNLNRITRNEFSNDDQVVSSTATAADGKYYAHSESQYDKAGRLLAIARYNGDVTAVNPAATTPIARWPLNDAVGATTAADTSGNTRGQVTDVAWSTDATRGSVGVFNGTTSKITMNQFPVDTTRAHSVSAWVKLAAKGTGYQFVLTVAGVIGNSALKLAYKGTADQWVVEAAQRKADGTNVWTGANGPAGQPQTGVWTHLAAVVDPVTNTLKLYVNGTEAGSATLAAPLNNNATSGYIGTQSSDAYFGGSLSDLQIYQGALTPAQVQAIKAGTAPASGAMVSRTSYTVDKGGLVLSETNPLGETTQYEYDEAGRNVVTKSPPVVSEVNGVPGVPARAIAYVGYNTFGDKTETKDPNGNRTTLGYDAEGRQTSATAPSYTPPGSSTPVTPTSTTEYDAGGRITTMTDPAGVATTYFYDQQDRVWKMRKPTSSGGVADTIVRYDKNGNVVATISPTGMVASAAYDFLDRKASSTVTSQEYGRDFTTNYTYGTGAYGKGPWLTKVESPAHVISSTDYNAAGQPLTNTDGAGKITQTIYDTVGRAYKTIYPDLTYASVNHDMLSQVNATAMYDSGGVAQVRTYASFDAAGQMVSRTDGLTHKTTFAYDATGLLVSQSEPINASDSIVSSFAYDAAGNRTRFTNGRNASFITTYNSLGLEESTIEPTTAAYPNQADRTYTKVYDETGRLASYRQPGGVTVDYTYDAAGYLVGQTGSGAEAATQSRTFGYDAEGRIMSFSGPDLSTNTVAYNDRGQVKSISNGSAGDSSFVYAPDGQLSSRVDGAGTTDYTYDTAGRLRTLINGDLKTTYDYNDMSAVSKITYGTGGGDYRDFTYWPTQLLKTDTLKTSSGTTVSSLAYEWDANGNPTKKTTTGFTGAATNVYTFDWANRLTSWTTTPAGGSPQPTVVYAYDKAGNRVQAGSKTFDYDERNRLTYLNASTQYTYTARGTLASVYDGSTTQTTTADAYGQIITQDSPSGTQTYTYDAVGRAQQPGKKFTGLDNDLAADSTASYIRDPSGDVVGERNSVGVGVYAWTDLHDDIFAQFGAADTGLSRTTVYDPLGKVLSGAGSLIGSLGYQSEWTDTATARVNMAARWYNPDTGQFDSRDTASNSPSPSSVNANRYAYGNANPLLHTDPSGHRVWDGDGGSGSTQKPSSSKPQQTWELQMYCLTHRVEAACKGVEPPGGGGTAKTRKTVTGNGGTYHGNTTKSGTAGQPKDGPPVTKEEIDKLKSEVEAAQKVANKSFFEVLLDCGVGMLMDFLGITDIINCFTKGDLWACGEMIIGLLPIGKIFSMGKKIFKLVDQAFSAYKAWRNAIKVAEEIISKGKKALEALEKLNNAADTINTVASAFGVDTGLPTLPLIPTGGKKPKGKPKHSASPGKPSKPKQHDGDRPPADRPADGDPHTPDKNNGTTPSQDSGNRPDSGNGTGNGNGKDSDTDGPPPGSSCKHSFDPATPVLMADGSVRPISDVNVGDKVVATDPLTGQTTAQPVTLLHRNNDVELTDVTITSAAPAAAATVPTGRDTSAGTVRGPTVTTLHTTQHHPFWDATDGQWIDAKDLVVGHELVGPDGEKQYVGAVRNFHGYAEMRDLTVANIHTYYVMAGDTPVLVHNTNGDICELPGGDVDDGTVGRLEQRVDAIMASGLGKKKRPGTVGETIGVRPSGLLVVVQTQSGVPGPLPGPLFQALTACGHSHGGCSEVSGIARVLELGATPLQTTSMGILSKRIGREWHRKTMDPCDSCKGLLDVLDMTWGR